MMRVPPNLALQETRRKRRAPELGRSAHKRSNQGLAN